MGVDNTLIEQIDNRNTYQEIKENLGVELVNVKPVLISAQVGVERKSIDVDMLSAVESYSNRVDVFRRENDSLDLEYLNEQLDQYIGKNRQWEELLEKGDVRDILEFSLAMTKAGTSGHNPDSARLMVLRERFDIDDPKSTKCNAFNGIFKQIFYCAALKYCPEVLDKYQIVSTGGNLSLDLPKSKSKDGGKYVAHSYLTLISFNVDGGIEFSVVDPYHEDPSPNSVDRMDYTRERSTDSLIVIDSILSGNYGDSSKIIDSSNGKKLLNIFGLYDRVGDGLERAKLSLALVGQWNNVKKEYATELGKYESKLVDLRGRIRTYKDVKAKDQSPSAIETYRNASMDAYNNAKEGY